MSVEITKLDELTSEEVQEKLSFLTRLLQEKLPMLDLSTGALHDVVLYLYAILEARTSKEISRYKSAQSLLDINADVTLSDEEIVNKVLSNYNVSRNPATYAKGRITVEYSSDVNTMIPAGTEFTFGGDVYAVTGGVLVMSTDSISSNKLIQLANGNYAFTVDVISRSAGATAAVLKGQELTTDLAAIVKAYAADDFTVGLEEETNLSMMSRLADGTATPCWGNRYQILKLLRSKVEDLTDASIVGFGDVEMTRDKLTAFPVSVGGRSDVYVKTTVQTRQYEALATFLCKRGVDEIWTATIPANAFPGCYRVVSVSCDDKEYAVTSQSVVDGVEGTADAVMSVEFATDDLLIEIVESATTKKKFIFSLIGQTSIDTVTDIFNDRQLMPVSQDVRVLTAHPAWVTVNLTLNAESENDDRIDAAINSMINTTGFCGRLTVASIIKAALPLLSPEQEILSVSLSVEIWGNDNQMFRAASQQILELPNDPDDNITSRTTVFYCKEVVRSY